MSEYLSGHIKDVVIFDRVLSVDEHRGIIQYLLTKDLTPKELARHLIREQPFF